MNELIARAEDHVRAHVAANFPATLRYHGIDHLLRVAQAARDLAKEAGVGKEEALALRLAALFHDSAYHLGADDHEARSADLAADFLRAEGVDAGSIDRVHRLILSTKADAVPSDELETLMKDADLAHLAGDDYLGEAELLRQELEAAKGVHFKKKAWIGENIAFMESHEFRSAAARALWSAGQERNLETLRRTLQERDEKKKEEGGEKKEKKAEKAEKGKRKETERGVETLFRVTLNNHTRLSQIADNKANMMLSVNALIISVLLTGLIPKLDTNPALLMPAGFLMLTCVISIITATLATRPKVTEGITSREAIRERKANLVFFGNFHKMPLDDFEWGMKEVMNDRDYLYGSLTRDLYFLGRVLHKKYRYLRTTYTIFMIGVIISVIAAIYAVATTGAQAVTP